MEKVILHFEDDEADHIALRRSMAPFLRNVKLNWIRDVFEGTAWINSNDMPDLLVLDYQLPGVDFSEWIPKIIAQKPGLPIVVLTAYQEPSFLKKIEQYGVAKVFNKNELLPLIGYIQELTEVGSKIFVAKDAQQHKGFSKLSGPKSKLVLGHDPVLIIDQNSNHVIACNNFFSVYINEGFRNGDAIPLAEFIDNHDGDDRLKQVLSHLLLRGVEPGDQTNVFGFKISVSNHTGLKEVVITEEEHATLNESFQRRLLTGALLELSQALVILDTDLNIAFSNPVFSDLIKESNSAFRDSNFKSILEIPDFADLGKRLMEVQNGVPVSITVLLVNKSNERFEGRFSCSFLPKGKGYYVLLFSEIKPYRAFNTEPLKGFVSEKNSLVPDYLLPLVKFHKEPVFLLSDSLKLIDFNLKGKEFLERRLFIHAKVGDKLKLKYLSEKNIILWLNYLQRGLYQNESFLYSDGDFSYEVFVSLVEGVNKARLLLVVAVEVSGISSIGDAFTSPGSNFHLLTETSNSVMFQLDREGKVNFLTDSVRQVTGFMKEDLLGKPIGNHQESPARNMFDGIFNELKSGKLKWRDGYANIKVKDGSERILKYQVQSILDHNGIFMGASGVYLDVTDAHHLSKALKESEHTLEIVAGNISDMVALHNEEGVIAYVTPSCHELTGYHPEELIGKYMQDYMHNEDKLTFERCLLELRHRPENVRKPLTLSFRLRKSDATYCWLETVMRISKDSDFTSSAAHIITSTRSIEEKIKTEEVLKETIDYLDAISEIQNTFISSNDIRKAMNHLLDHVIRVTESKFGFIAEVLYDPEGNIYMRSLALTNIAWDKASRTFYENNIEKGLEFRNLDSLFGKVLREKRTYISNRPHQDPNAAGVPAGHPVLTSFAGIPIFKKDQMVAVIGLANAPDGYEQDHLTKMEPLVFNVATILEHYRVGREMKQTGEKLKKSEAELTAILTSVEDIVFELDENQIFRTIWCKDDTQLLMPRSQFLNKSVKEVFPDVDPFSRILKALDEVYANGAKQSVEYALAFSDGHIHWYEADIMLIQASEQKQACILVRDITLRKNSESEMLRNLEKEKELTQLKSRFINMTSHEFRTPLTSISSSTELIRMNLDKIGLKSDTKINKYFSTIQSEISRMTTLLNEVLILGKIEAGKMPVAMMPMQFGKLVGEIVDKLVQTGRIPEMPQIVEQGKALEVMTDPKLMDHILDNLLSNAFKYSPGKPVPQVVLNFAKTGYSLAVVDQGIGIPEEEVKDLFEQFFRASNVNRIQGVGLGLVIVKKMVELMNGTIKVNSKENEGTVVTIEFKLK